MKQNSTNLTDKQQQVIEKIIEPQKKKTEAL
jgi:Spy/CpxP family protein refolding chaperone